MIRKSYFDNAFADVADSDAILTRRVGQRTASRPDDNSKSRRYGP